MYGYLSIIISGKGDKFYMENFFHLCILMSLFSFNILARYDWKNIDII